jgi:hypothetical protein
MKRMAFSLLLALAAVTGWLASTPPRTVDAGGFEWITDYKAGLEKARTEEKPIFLEFR